MKTLVPLLGVLGMLLGNAASAVQVQAMLEWSRRVELSTPVSGTVTEVNVEPGNQVKKGQVLLRLDPRGFQANVLQARARVESTIAARKEAHRELERAQDLYDRTVLSDHELQLAKIAFAKADAAYSAAQAGLTEAQLTLEYSAVRAPFDGIVIDRKVDVGQAVVSEITSEPLVVLAAAGRMIARASVAEAQLAGLSVGQSVRVTIGGKTYQGKVKHIGLEPVAQAQGAVTYPVDVEFPTGAEVLRAGQPASLDLP